MYLGLLAALSASAAAGMRIALPLLIVGLLQSDSLWENVPLLSMIHPQVLLGILTSWSLFELFGSKKLLGLRILQMVQLGFSPIVGALMGITAAKITQSQFDLELGPLWLIGLIGGVLAFVLKFVQVGWFFRLQKLPLWAIFSEDILCIFLVFFAFQAPEQGGLIAMLLLWLSVRSSQEWYRWYRKSSKKKRRL
ncbi:DUF4126 domain-containing protein [Lusitaniella coriacea LEGE 07157]|uniref:DUF4126 domain-containing protein n=1 Tax=Lusitaniella coriacea LEGE 07157 TaxID=945747 RepID=A0A8J7IVL9_9CYAN|nr:DUF4126 domain-containing protein [Lusitaniella coriacea]MBE9117373.1 DUF4126 domain-containing protein [Lusitaniella coriacea LEGE 07157]